jgi:23S rRNA pseudouridine2605 synthase
MRLNRYLARGGVASRRSSDALIAAGRVTVNGDPVTRLGSTVKDEDRVCLDGTPVEIAERNRYLALHKPPGFVCTAHDPQRRRRALELVADDGDRLFGVGRLDYRSSGLLLFTTDGQFAEHAAHPSYGVEKDYLVRTAAGASIPDDLLRGYRSGLWVDGERYRLTRYERHADDQALLTLPTGKNREIRRVFAAAGIELGRVHRIRIGPVRLGTLDSGHHRALTDEEVAWFLRLEKRSSR